MDQEKIGKFLKKLRLDKNLTQDQLANKLNVSDKTISKWENGRGLMDISFLKPLSEILEVSILEILNGERISYDNIADKSGEIIENTLIFNKKELQLQKLKIIFSMSISFIFIILSILLINQSLNYMRYSNDLDDKSNIQDKFSFKNNITIYKKTLDSSDYFPFNSLKIKNIFSELSLINEKSNTDAKYPWYSYGKDNKVLISFSENIDDLSLFSNMNDYNDNYGNIFFANVKSFLLEEDINNDIDLYNYINKNGYKKNDFFVSKEKMKFNLVYNNLIYLISNKKKGDRYLIKGDYLGYVFVNNNNKEITVVLLKDGNKYMLSFYDEYANLDFVLDVVSTIELK